MAERVYRTEALILRRSDYAEADRLLLMATPNGKRHVIAKGARKTRSRLAGHIELFTQTTLLLAIGRSLDIVTQSQVINAFPTLRTDLMRLGCAYYVVELYDKFTEEEEENRPLFQLLIQTFAALDMSVNPGLVLRSYELQLLQLMGYRPNFHRCVVCDEVLTESATRFSPNLGGMLCPRDQHADRAAVLISLNSFKLLRFLQSQPLQSIEQMNISAPVRHEARNALRAYLRHLLERELKSVAFLEEVARDG